MTPEDKTLALAAKAAGLTILGGFGFGGRPGCDVLDESRNSGTRWWSPATEDDHALQLAALLGMDFRMDAADGEMLASCYAMGSLGHPCPGEVVALYVGFDAHEVGTTEPYRRAAVALAAKIGETMP